MRPDDVRLLDILESAEDIGKFLKFAPDEESFETNHLVRSAVLMQVLFIGEAAAKISEQIRHRYSEIPWSKLRGIRNFIAHEYFLVDWSIVWEAGLYEVPELVPQILQILRHEYPDVYLSWVHRDEIQS
jgi:uncharacterized protein with HEPN domain